MTNSPTITASQIDQLWQIFDDIGDQIAHLRSGSEEDCQSCDQHVERLQAVRAALRIFSPANSAKIDAVADDRGQLLPGKQWSGYTFAPEQDYTTQTPE
ncbi:MAG: hypothetical protein Unbinned7015contig1001_27 [Prokaryotic dsDNA virus sp.]|nr:MAG: hypothetical protein Unbinned7015contig1001_27 [Prokaryotic dsDNA virus sp.]|tara:strand:+ start:7869 stop:8165 length:297 start_codon:yes stop_codon:yes gene_type:complete